MANIFLSKEYRDLETAKMLEKATVADIGKAVAYTDGNRVVINTEDNLYKILPNYNYGMLKWLLWHERYHMELNHHKRYFVYARQVQERKVDGEKVFVNKEEANIIMDILVHDNLSEMFPELVETAISNTAQMRNRNCLGYTFKTFTLEEMLKEYEDFKKLKVDEPGGDEGEENEEEENEGEGKEPKEGDERGESESKSKSTDKKDKTDKKEKSYKENKDSEKQKSKSKEETEEDTEEKETPEETASTTPKEEVTDDHDKTDWSELEGRDTREFVYEYEINDIERAVNELKQRKIRLGTITEKLNSLVTTTRQRTYAKPNPIKLSGGAILKGSRPGRAKLYLCFDASGSMHMEMDMFKEIISKSIPQAMDTPTAWFSGWNSPVARDPKGRSEDYYKGTFKDFIKVNACEGYCDDGDRTIELCWKAEQEGYSPIGITDGGGKITWSTDMLKQLKRTTLVGDCSSWLKAAKKINPSIQIISTEED